MGEAIMTCRNLVLVFVVVLVVSPSTHIFAQDADDKHASEGAAGGEPDILSGLLASFGENPGEMLAKIGGLGQIKPLVDRLGGLDNVMKMMQNDKDFSGVAQQLLKGDLKNIPDLLGKNSKFLSELLGKGGEGGGVDPKQLSSLFGGLLESEGGLSEVAKRLGSPEEINRIMNDPEIAKLASGLMKDAGLPNIFGGANPADFLKNFNLDSVLKGDGSDVVSNMMKALVDEGGMENMLSPDGPFGSLLDEKNIQNLAGILGNGDFDSFLSNMLGGDGLESMMKGFLGGDMGKLFDGLDLDTAMKGLGGLVPPAKAPSSSNNNNKKKVVVQKPAAPPAAEIPNLEEFKAMVHKLGGVDKVAEMMEQMGMGDMLVQAGGVDALAALITADQEEGKHDEL